MNVKKQEKNSSLIKQLQIYPMHCSCPIRLGGTIDLKLVGMVIKDILGEGYKKCIKNSIRLHGICKK